MQFRRKFKDYFAYFVTVLYSHGQIDNIAHFKQYIMKHIRSPKFSSSVSNCDMSDVCNMHNRYRINWDLELRFN